MKIHDMMDGRTEDGNRFDDTRDIQQQPTAFSARIMNTKRNKKNFESLPHNKENFLPET